MHADPYAPPASSLSGPTPAEQGVIRYSGFWQRVGAYLIDLLVVAPLGALDFFIGGSSHLYPLYIFIPGQCLGLFLHVWMVRKYGGTPGKLVLGLRISMSDGAAVTLPATLLRYAVMWGLGLSSSLALIMAAMKISDENYAALSYLQRSQELVANAPGWFTAVTVVSQIWVVACLITMLANKERRSLHDFIAGTAVLRK